MKKRTIFISSLMCLLLIFSSFSVFAEDIGIIGGADGETQILVDDEEMSDEEVAELLMNSDYGNFIVLVGFSGLFSMLFIPALVVMIIMISKNNKAKKELEEYRAIYGPLAQMNNFNGNYQNSGFNNGYYPQNGTNNNQGGQM